MTRHLIPFAALGLVGCATTPPPRGTLHVVVAPLAHAAAPSRVQVYVDDVFVGAAGGDLLLRAGFHRVEVRADGYLAAYRELNLARDQRLTLDVPLRPDLDERDAEATP